MKKLTGFFYKRSQSKKINLPNVTLVTVSSIKLCQTVLSLKKSMRKIDFAEVILFSHKRPWWLDKKIKFIQCEPIRSLKDYSRFILYELDGHINTDFTLVVQYDSWVLRPQKWTNQFLQYDYVGAPWPKNTA